MINTERVKIKVHVTAEEANKYFYLKIFIN